ncbi:MAG: rhodanese-like domain-containing protein [Nanoarchaeota archaeon]
MKLISPAELNKKLKNKKEFILLDVREQYEVDFCKIEDSIHIRMNEIPQNLKKIDKNKEIIVYCHTEARSMRVTDFLNQKGYNAYNLEDGIDAYSKIDKKIKKY